MARPLGNLQAITMASAQKNRPSHPKLTGLVAGLPTAAHSKQITAISIRTK